MKLATESCAEATGASASNEVELPQGLVGFPDMKRAEIVFAQEELPFMRLREVAPEGLTFLVVEPHGIVPDYEVELLDMDQESLGIKDPADAMVLNIATIHRGQPMRVTLNLVGPIIVNRRTRQAKQVVIANFEDYSSRYLLHQEG